MAGSKWAQQPGITEELELGGSRRGSAVDKSLFQAVSSLILASGLAGLIQGFLST